MSTNAIECTSLNLTSPAAQGIKDYGSEEKYSQLRSNELLDSEADQELKNKVSMRK